jgi:sialidase-1
MSGVKNACNGEIMLVPAVRKSDKKRVWVALQSIPFGPGRTNVGLFFHELSDKHESAANFAANWTKGLQLSTIESAYSTFILQHDYRFGFLWEEGPAWYHIDYRSLTMEEITNGLYTLDRKRAKRSEWK